MGKLAAIALPISPRFPRRACGYHALGAGAGFVAHDCVCDHGVRSPLAEGVYTATKIGVMLDGAFQVRTQQGSVVVGPGALLIGNRGAGYEYRHVNDGGDRSIVFDYDDAFLDELGRPGFRRLAVPASAATAHAIALADDALHGGDLEALREAALAVAAVAIAADRETDRSTATPAVSTRRIAEALRYIAAHHADDCSLDTLAALAGLSNFHFLRSFRAVTGQTPRQVVIATRLRAAASLLRSTQRPILAIAFAAGFGDASHFTASFTRAFRLSPAAYRRAHSRRAAIRRS